MRVRPITKLLGLTLLLFVFAFSCTRQTEETQEEGIAGETKITTEAPSHETQQQTKLQELQKEAELRLAAIREKEELLQQKEAKLDSIEKELSAREQQLIESQLALKQFRTTSYIILLIGIALIVLFVFLILKKRKSTEQQQSTEQKEQEIKPAPDKSVISKAPEKSTRSKTTVKAPAKKSAPKTTTKTAAKKPAHKSTSAAGGEKAKTK